MNERAALRRTTAVAAFAATSIWIFFLLAGDRLAARTDEELLRLHLDPLHLVKNVLSLISFVAALGAMAGLRERLASAAAAPAARLGLIAFAVGTAVDGLFRAVEAVTVERVWAGRALAAVEEGERAAYLAKIEGFREVGEGVFPVFGTFFVLAYLLFAFASRRTDRALSALLAAAGLAMATLYLAAYLEAPLPGPTWTGYELLMIALWIRLGVVLARPWPDAAPS